MDKELKELLAQFNALQGDMQATLTKQSAEIRAHGESSGATAKRVDELTNQLTEVGQQMRELQNRLGEAETQLARPGGANGAQAQSVGERFVASDQYQEMIRNNRERSEVLAVGSFFPRNATLTSAPDSAGSLVEPHRLAQIIAAPERGLRLRDVMDVQTTSSNSIEYVEETGFTNNAGMQVEGQQKAESGLQFELKNATVQTIAHWIPATRQILSDAGQLRGHIDTRLIYGLKVKEESQILYGSGVSPNLPGITTNARIQKYLMSAGKVGDTKIDAIRRAITKARIAEYPVNAIVLHPTDWEEIETAKGSDQKYIWVQVSEGGVMRLWRVPVVETTAINAGESLLGAFGMAATLWDREQAGIRVSDSHADFFTTNKVAVLAEERLALSLYRPEGFVLVDFDGAPAAGD